MYLKWPINNDLPHVCLIISPSMKQQYDKYGYVVKLDYTFGLIKDKIKVIGTDINSESE